MVILNEVRNRLNRFCKGIYIIHSYEHDKSIRVYKISNLGYEGGTVCKVTIRKNSYNKREYRMIYGPNCDIKDIFISKENEADLLFTEILKILLSNNYA